MGQARLNLKLIVSDPANVAHGLGLQVVAEGVETQVQLDFLNDHLCDEIHSYLISPALPAAAFVAFAQILREQLAVV
jgi:EAL domain-containing protein (putative c-di-GMP-specific phosphodiesterase class I)